jgi:signal transduction histidine kinase
VAGRARPSAALLLGALAGCAAAIGVLPTAIPLTQRLSHAEQALALRQASNAAQIAAGQFEQSGSLAPGFHRRLGMDHLEVTDDRGIARVTSGVELPPTLASNALAACGAPAVTAPAVDDLGQDWAVACATTGAFRTVAAWRPEYGSSAQVRYLVVTLAAIVGIVTSLAVLRLLYPLSRLSRALVRVGAGERGVRVPATGLGELDELVDQLNATARAMEDREDAILARFQTVQRMARMVAHEVRNPLQSLELLTSLIAAEEVAAERDALARSIQEEIRALDMVVTRVLREGAHRGHQLPLHRTKTRLAPIVQHVLTLRSPEARVHGIELVPGTLDPVEAEIDAALVGRSIENLVLNALQAVPPSRGKVQVSLIGSEAEARIVVDDNGPGVDPELADHVFEIDVTGRTGGTGLGLALVKEVIDAHRGYVSHDRSPLGGARFTARLPLRAQV